MRSRRKAKARASATSAQGAAEDLKDPELRQELDAGDAQRHELGQQHGESELGRSSSGRLLDKEGRHELAGKHGVSELVAEQRHELEGHSVELPRSDVDR